jgi:hypothetical protein
MVAGIAHLLISCEWSLRLLLDRSGGSGIAPGMTGARESGPKGAEQHPIPCRTELEVLLDRIRPLGRR